MMRPKNVIPDCDSSVWKAFLNMNSAKRIECLYCCKILIVHSLSLSLISFFLLLPGHSTFQEENLTLRSGMDN